jgi:phage shock protein PspC (stress-responsive transcriptional regulator)
MLIMRAMNPESNPESTQSPGAGPQSRPLFRPHEGRILTGTAAGIAAHLGVDPTIIRVLFAVLAVMGGAGVPLYVAAWLLIPEEGTDRPIAADPIDRARFTLGGAS